MLNIEGLSIEQMLDLLPTWIEDENGNINDFSLRKGYGDFADEYRIGYSYLDYVDDGDGGIEITEEHLKTFYNKNLTTAVRELLIWVIENYPKAIKGAE